MLIYSIILFVCLFFYSFPAQRSSEGQKNERIFAFLFFLLVHFFVCVCGAERICSEPSYEVCNRKDGRGRNSEIFYIYLERVEPWKKREKHLTALVFPFRFLPMHFRR